MKLAIIVGSTRQQRKGIEVGRWVAQQSAEREAATYELVDLMDFHLPLLWEATLPGAAQGSYEAAETQAWSRAIAEFDGYVFVTAEYNHSVPAAFKNAVDVLSSEWAGKPVTFVSYGADGGVRAVEHWRQILANLSMFATRNVSTLGLFTDFSEGQFAPSERRAAELDKALTELEQLSQKLQGSHGSS